MDLGSVADGNSDVRRAAADDLVGTDPSTPLAEFHAFAGTSAFSTNAWSDKIRTYDDADAILDTRRVRIAQAGGNVAAGLAKFAEGGMAARREAFEDLWAGGREFVYGVVNAGGMGAETYGPFCLVLADPGRSALAVFPDDSAERYTTIFGKVNGALAMTEATPWDRRADLVTTERHSQVDSETERWPRLVCHPDRYFEAVTRPGPATADIDEVRLREPYARRLDLLQARHGAGDVLTRDELNEIAAYDVIQSWRRSFRTTITEVDR